jgi:hypothetical protein
VQYWVLGTSNHSPWQATLRRGIFPKLSTSQNQDGLASAASIGCTRFNPFWGRNWWALPCRSNASVNGLV